MRKRVDRQCRCGAIISWCSNVCVECSSRRYFHSRYLSGAQLVQGQVAKARRHGVLADPRTFPCADCGGAATEYDHRDYNHPLKVEPVCRGCNARRGRAVAKQWRAGEWAAYLEQVAKTNWPGRRHVIELYERFKHELRPDIFGPAPKPSDQAAA